MPIPKNKIDKVREVIRRHVDWFIGRVFGNQYTDDPAHVSAPDTVEGLPSSLTQMSFVLGKEEAQLKESEWKTYSWDSMAHAAEQVTPEEQAQVDAAAFSAHSKFRKLGDDITNGVFSRLAVANNEAVSEAQIRGIIADKIETGVLLGRRHKDVARDLATALKDNSRDWLRVAATELHHARQNGVAHAIVNKIGIYAGSQGSESLVTVVPAPDACKECVRMYLENGKPKIFPLSTLMDNAGTNYTKPWRQNAQPVVPPLHPNCYCRIRYAPPGWGWDDEGKFTMTKPDEAFPSVDKAKDQIPGGLADDQPVSAYDPEALKEGIKVEMEHTSSRSIASEIARDHLEEDPEYYKKLRKIEGDVHKAIDDTPHSLLQGAVNLPNPEYIKQISAPEELNQLQERLEKLEQMYIRHPEIHKQVTDLIHETRKQRIVSSGVLGNVGDNNA